MAKHALKVLRYSHRKIFKYVWSFFHIMYERVKAYITTIQEQIHLFVLQFNCLVLCNKLFTQQLVQSAFLEFCRCSSANNLLNSISNEFLFFVL